MTTRSSPHADATNSAQRYHGLDFIRASMLLLGVVIHVAVSFVEGPAGSDWPYRDPNATPWAGFIVLAIHIFRMPAFFVIAGFFAALIQDRKGLIALARNRFFRIAIPLGVGWVLIFPIVNIIFLIGMKRALGSGAHTQTANVAIAVEPSSSPWANPQPIHLWFLYYLLMLYAIAVVIIPFSRFAPASLRTFVAQGIHALMQGRLRLLRMPILVALTWLAMLPMQMPSIDTPSTFMPLWHVLVCYGFFFAVGWTMFLERGMIESLKAWAGTRMICGVIVLVVSLALAASWLRSFHSGSDTASPTMQTLLFWSQASIALTVWLLIFGGVGLAERMLQRPNSIVRYFSDSSYWIYLVHLPICVLVVIALRDWNASGMSKVSAAVGISIAISILSYEAVRGTMPQQMR
jgi:fucose 4-O-acetylase-like acetyltransferase